MYVDLFSYLLRKQKILTGVIVLGGTEMVNVKLRKCYLAKRNLKQRIVAKVVVSPCDF